MPEPISTVAEAAAIVGLADVVCRAGRHLYKFFSEMKDAPNEVRLLRNELNRLDMVLGQIKTYAEQLVNSSFSDGRTLKDVVKACQLEFLSLEDNTNRASQARGTFAKLEDRLMWVLGKEKTAQACQRLERCRMDLTLALQLVTGSV